MDHQIYDPGGQGGRNTLKELKGGAMESKINITQKERKSKLLNNDPYKEESRFLKSLKRTLITFVNGACILIMGVSEGILI